VVEVLEVGARTVNILLSRARESVRAGTGLNQPALTETLVQQLLEGYVLAWRLADLDEFVLLAAEDVHAFATYEPDGEGHLAVSGLQVLQLGEVNGQLLISTLVSYRDPALAIRCGLPPFAA